MINKKEGIDGLGWISEQKAYQPKDIQQAKIDLKDTRDYVEKQTWNIFMKIDKQTFDENKSFQLELIKQLELSLNEN